jgi:hypothetical protein
VTIAVKTSPSIAGILLPRSAVPFLFLVDARV